MLSIKEVHLPTKPTWGNCFFATLYLILRGKVKKIIAINSESPWWPHHYLVANKKGHILHFNHVHSHVQNRFAPWWFEGQFVGVRKRDQEKLLKKMKRTVIFQRSVWFGGFALLAVYVILFVPWVLTWTLFTPLWCVWWTFDALRKRFWKRRRI